MSESTAAASSTLQLLDGDQTIMIPSASSSGTSMVHSAAHIRRSPTNTVSVTPTSAAATTTTTSSSHHHTTTTTSTSSVAASTHLGARLVGDVLVATAVTAAVAPFLTVVDQAIVESTAGSKTLVRSGLDSIRFMTSNPGSYVRSPTFLLMWGVYAATYATANSFKTLEEHSRFQQEASRTTNTTSSSSSSSAASSIGLGQVGIFLGTTVVNSGTSMMKDRAYAQMFGSGTASVTFPKASYAFWALRDLSVIGSSFILPDLVATKLAGDYGMDKATALSYCQLTIPVATQLIAGPFHFLGLDVYNRNLNHLASRWSVAADRMRQLSQSFGPVVMARMARIAPGYGIGGVWNTKLRMAWRDHLVERQIKHMMRDGGTTNSSNNNKSTGLVALLYGVKSRVW